MARTERTPTLQGDVVQWRAAPPALDHGAHALFLDLDGTLLEIADRPDLVSTDAEHLQRLRLLSWEMRGALAVITGRGRSDAERLLCGAVDCISGLHGQEGDAQGADAAPLADVRAAAGKVADLVNAGALNVLIEDKGGAVALHYRHQPVHEDLIRRAAREIADAHGLCVVPGKMVVEIMPKGATKFKAVIDFMKQPAFAARVPIAVGDDITDEDAFLAAAQLGGFGVLVGPERPSHARYRLDRVSDVWSWLSASAERR